MYLGFLLAACAAKSIQSREGGQSITLKKAREISTASKLFLVWFGMASHIFIQVVCYGLLLHGKASHVHISSTLDVCK